MRSWPDLIALELLVAVADHGSVARAARALGVAQPNASRSLARLERNMGLGLLVRSTQGASVTPAGVLVVDWARAVLEAARTLDEGVSALVGSGSPGLSVAASQTVAEHLLPRWLVALRKQHPDCAVQVMVENTTGVIELVRGGGAVLGFVEGPGTPNGVHSMVVARDELVLVVAPHHPWAARRTAVSADELAETPLLIREPGSGTRVALDEALGRPALSLQELTSNAAIRVAAQTGAAPAVLSRLAVADALAADHLLEVPMVEIDLHRPLRAIWAGPRRLAGLAADLLAVAAGLPS